MTRKTSRRGFHRRARAVGRGDRRLARWRRAGQLNLGDVKKDTDIACLYHCDFGDPQRFSQLLTNMNNHLSVYEFDPMRVKLVIVAHGRRHQVLPRRPLRHALGEGPDRRGHLQALRRADQVRGRGLSVRDHLQAPEHRHGQDAERSVPEIRAVGRGDRRRTAGQGLCVSEGGVGPRVRGAHQLSEVVARTATSADCRAQACDSRCGGNASEARSSAIRLQNSPSGSSSRRPRRPQTGTAQ